MCPHGGGGGPREAALGPAEAQDQSLSFVNGLIPAGLTRPAAPWPSTTVDKTPVISSGVRRPTVFTKTNRVRNQQQPQKCIFSFL